MATPNGNALAAGLQVPDGDQSPLTRRVIDHRGITAKTGLSHQTQRHYMCDPSKRHRMPPGAFKRPGGRAWLWYEDEVDAWLATGQRAPEPQAIRRLPGRPKGSLNKPRHVAARGM